MDIESNNLVTLTGENRTLFCGNCKKKIHCIGGKKDKSEKIEMVKDRCNNDDCECRCRTHYIGKDGRLHKYGTIDNSTAIDEPAVKYDDETDKLIQRINKMYRSNERKENKAETLADICDELKIPFVSE